MSREELVGRWLERDGRVVRDEACEEIERLTSKVWDELARREAGWTTLYRDPATGAYWERSYPSSHLPGGGPPTVRKLSDEEVVERYGSDLL